jgi:hypothetical protein
VSGHELLTALNAFVFEGTRHPRRRQRPAEKTAQCPEECSSVHTHPVQRAASGDTEEASGDTEEIVMERKLVDVGHRVETQLESGLISDITHAATDSEAVGRIVGAAALKKAAAAAGNGIQDRRDEVIAYARRELALR